MDVDVSMNTRNRSNCADGKPHLMLGKSDFFTLLGENETYFIDKTLLIKVFFDHCGAFKLVTAPPRFGKTTNNSMFQRFLEIQETDKKTHDGVQESIRNSENYIRFSEKNLNIMKKKGLVKKHFGKYPVISLDLKCESSICSLEEAMAFCRVSIGKAFKQHSYLQHSDKLTLSEKKEYQDWCEGNIQCRFRIARSVLTLVSFLYKHYGQNVFLLVDDYDSIIFRAMLTISNKEHLGAILDFTASIVRSAVGGSGTVGFVAWALITGISDVGLSGSNICRYHFLRDGKFAPFYGLTNEEVEGLLTTSYNLTEEQIEVARNKFNGYTSVTNTKIYSFWSLLEYAANPEEFRCRSNFWADTAMIAGLKNAFKIPYIKGIIESQLLLRKSITARKGWIMTEDNLFVLSKIMTQDDPQFFKDGYTYLFFCFLREQGYLIYKKNPTDMIYFEVRVPNEDILNEFKKLLE